MKYVFAAIAGGAWEAVACGYPVWTWVAVFSSFAALAAILMALQEGAA